MAKEVSAFLWSEGLNDATDLPHPAWNSVLGGPAQMGLQSHGLIVHPYDYRVRRELLYDLNPWAKTQFYGL